MLPVPRATAPPPIKRISNKDWLSGVVTAYDDGRTPIKGLRSSGNVYLDQDGIIRPRPSLTQYGPQPVGVVLGEIFEFRALSGLVFTNWMISLQNVSGTTNVYIAKGEDTTWTKCTAGTTFDNTASAHFCQVQNKVLIMNATDTLAYLDVPTSTVTKFTALSNPGIPTIVNNGTTTLITSTILTIYYAVTANSTVGESAAGTIGSQTINLDRDSWDPTKNSLKITWTAVTNAKSYNLYAGVADSGAGVPTLYKIATGLPAEASPAFIDDGSSGLELLNVAPTANSTAGPKVSRGTVINGRPFLVGDSVNPFYVWNGGDPGFELDFTYVNGGGFSQVGNGTKELPIAVKPFHQGKGDPGVFVLTQGTNGSGKRYILSPDSVTYGGTTITFFDVNEDNGTDGTDSPDGVIIDQDALWYPSRDGFKTTGTKPQLQNILSTNRVSNTIQTDIKTLNNSSMSMCVGLAFEGRLYWALPVGSGSNSEIWVLDLDRQGAWMKPWNIAAAWMWLYNDNSGTTHHLILKNNIVYQLSYTALTADDGTAFSTSFNSGQIPFSPDSRVWGKLLKVIFVLLRPQGSLNFTISGKTEDSALSVVGTGLFTSTSTQAGWSEPGAGWSSLRGWSEIVTVPRSFNDATQEVAIDIDEDLQWFSYGGTSTGTGVDYGVSDIIAEYIEIGVKDLS